MITTLDRQGRRLLVTLAALALCLFTVSSEQAAHPVAGSLAPAPAVSHVTDLSGSTTAVVIPRELAVRAAAFVPAGPSCGNACSGDGCSGNACSGDGCSGNACRGDGCSGNACSGDGCSGNACRFASQSAGARRFGYGGGRGARVAARSG
ncbi:MAG: hypothetical protein ACREQ5_27460 [Candidatus Dormibacteria bacterium]